MPPERRPVRRTILKVLILLLAWGAAGATLNVAVAWGCACSPMRWTDHDFMIEHGKWLNPPRVPKRQSRWGVIADRGTFRSHFRVIVEGDFSGDLTIVPSLDRETPGWVDRCLTDEKVGYLEWLHHDRIIQAAGWPTLALSAYFDTDFSRTIHRVDWAAVCVFNRPGDYEATIIPIRPIWPGFAVNTLFYTGVLWMLFAGPFALRRMIRRRRGQCPACAYPIGTSEVCTECGAAVRLAT